MIKKLLIILSLALIPQLTHAATFPSCLIVSGCTGTSTLPSYGQLLTGNNVSGYNLTSTSSLGISTASNDIYVFEGDSISAVPGPSGTGNEWPLQLKNFEYQVKYGQNNYVATSGETSAQVLAEYSTQVHPLRPTSSNTNAVFFLVIGTNDLAHLVATSTFYSNVKAEWALARADGFRVIASTIPQSTMVTYGNDGINGMNALIMSDTSLYDGLMRPDIWFSDPRDQNFFLADQVHPNGNANLLWAKNTASILQTGNDRVFLSAYGDTIMGSTTNQYSFSSTTIRAGLLVHSIIGQPSFVVSSTSVSGAPTTYPFVVTNSGVGIGTSTPTLASLVVGGIAGNTGIDVASADLRLNARVIANTADATYPGGDATMYLGYNQRSGGAIHFYGQGTNIQMSLNGPTGNLGIGTTSPYAKLSVVGDVVASTLTATSSLSVGTGSDTNSSVQYGPDNHAWTQTYVSSDNSLRIASGTDPTSNIAINISKGGAISFTGALAFHSQVNIDNNTSLLFLGGASGCTNTSGVKTGTDGKFLFDAGCSTKIKIPTGETASFSNGSFTNQWTVDENGNSTQNGTASSTAFKATSVTATSTFAGGVYISQTSSSTAPYIYSKTSGFGGHLILEDEGGGACTELTTKAGVLNAKVITCPTEI